MSEMYDIFYSKRNSVRGYQIPEGEDAVEELVKALKAEGVHCSAHPGPTVLIAAGTPQGTASPIIAYPGSWVAIWDEGAVWHYSDEQFQSQFDRVPVKLLPGAEGPVASLNVTMTLDEVEPFVKQLEIGSAEGYESPLGEYLKKMLEAQMAANGRPFATSVTVD